MAKKSKSPFRGGHKHIKREDAFIRLINKVYQYYVKAPVSAVITTLAVVGIIVVGIILINRWTSREPKAPPHQASLMLLSAQALLEQDPQQAVDSLQNLATRYPRTLPGKKARYYLGQSLYMTGDYAQALTEFEKFEKDYGVKESFLPAAALYAQGNCLEEMENYQDAVARYLSLVEKYPESSYVPFAKLGAGRCMVLLGQYQQAREFYEGMLEEYPESENKLLNDRIEGELGRVDALINNFESQPQGIYN